MDTNMTFSSVGYQGSATVNAIVQKNSNGYFTYGGIIDPNDANNLGLTGYFGYVVSAKPATPELYVLGLPSASYQIRGILFADPAIAQNEPFKNNYFLQGIPVSVLYSGLVVYNSFAASTTGATATPTIASIPAYNKATGEVQFVAPSTTLASGWDYVPAIITETSPLTGVPTVSMQFNVWTSAHV